MLMSTPCTQDAPASSAASMHVPEPLHAFTSPHSRAAAPSPPLSPPASPSLPVPSPLPSSDSSRSEEAAWEGGRGKAAEVAAGEEEEEEQACRSRLRAQVATSGSRAALNVKGLAGRIFQQ
jgi:hypothetical protein